MTIRDQLDAWADRLSPGMGGRPLYLMVIAALALVLYHHHGAPHAAPAWFLEGAASISGIEVESLHRHLWSHVSAVVLLMLAPLAIVWIAEGWGPGELGLSIPRSARELALVLALFAGMLPLVAYFSTTSSFLAMYPRVPEARTDVYVLTLHVLLYLPKWVAWEFFFRGFLLFGAGRDFLGRASLISTVPFVLMHFGKPEAEVLGAIVAGLVLCAIAERSRSIWPGVLVLWLVASSMDIAASDAWR